MLQHTINTIERLIYNNNNNNKVDFIILLGWILNIPDVVESVKIDLSSNSSIRYLGVVHKGHLEK